MVARLQCILNFFLIFKYIWSNVRETLKVGVKFLPSPCRDNFKPIRIQAKPGQGQGGKCIDWLCTAGRSLCQGCRGFLIVRVFAFPRSPRSLFIKLYLTEVWTSYALIATYLTKVTNQIRSNKYWVTLPRCGLTAIQTFYFWQDKNYVPPLQDRPGLGWSQSPHRMYLS